VHFLIERIEGALSQTTGFEKGEEALDAYEKAKKEGIECKLLEAESFVELLAQNRRQAFMAWDTADDLEPQAR
jgi:pheromone shutdown protein TraB